jgi:hypothetical protein
VTSSRKLARNPLPPPAEFLLNAPLYEKFDASNSDTVRKLFGTTTFKKFDGHCPYCHDRTTYSRSHGELPLFPGNKLTQPDPTLQTQRLVIQCARVGTHVIEFLIKFDSGMMRKIGQFPSLADVANDESKVVYRGVLRPEDGSELYKAIGLAAHGVGIGSFVYLRRIFERLI